MLSSTDTGIFAPNSQENTGFQEENYILDLQKFRNIGEEKSLRSACRFIPRRGSHKVVMGFLLGCFLKRKNKICPSVKAIAEQASVEEKQNMTQSHCPGFAGLGNL